MKTGRELQLTWQSNSEDDLVGYRVYRNDDGSPYVLIMAVDQTTTKVFDTGLINKMTYRYYITAIDEVPNESEPSGVRNGIPMDSISPSTPQDVKAKISKDKRMVIISWTPVNDSDVHVYQIFRSTDNSNFEKIAEVEYTKSSFEDNSVVPGETYYYKVAAADDSPNISPKSKPIEIDVPEKGGRT